MVKIKVRVADTSVAEKTAKRTDVYDYVKSVQNARKDFYEDTSRKGIAKVLSDCKFDLSRWRIAEGIRSPIAKWLNTESIKFTLDSEVGLENAAPNRPNKVKKARGRPRKDSESNAMIKEEVPEVSKKENKRKQPAPKKIKAEEQGSSKLQSVPIFQSRNFVYQLGSSSSDTYQVAQMSEELKKKDGEGASPTKVFSELSKLKEQRHSSQILFCGGPISSIATCPRRTSHGDELVALSTFADEKMLSLKEECAYVQFWTFPSDLSLCANLEFLLEIPDISAVLHLTWCPLLTESSKKPAFSDIPSSSDSGKNSVNAKKKRKVFIPALNVDILGFLAVGTNDGRILIYCIPANIDSLKNLKKNPPSKPAKKREENGTSATHPLILNAEAVFVLEHPVVSIRTPDDGNKEIFLRKTPKKKGKANEEPEILVPKLESFTDMYNFPIISVSWSPFCNGRSIAGISAAGRILVWDIENTEITCPLIIFSAAWTSPPLVVNWLNENNIAVSFRAKVIRVYNVVSETCVYEDQTARTCGTMLMTCPSILPGLLAYDTTVINLYDIHYTCSVYLAFENDDYENFRAVPTFNSHQVQAMRAVACENSGIVGSVGVDGRYICTLTGRMSPHNAVNEHSFTLARTLLQVISHRIQEETAEGSKSNSAEKEDQSKICYAHHECCANKWLEIRVGDAAMRDQITMRRCRTRVPEACLDRRLESLTLIDYSYFTPGLAVVGGESGMLFIIPSTL